MPGLFNLLEDWLESLEAWDRDLVSIIDKKGEFQDIVDVSESVLGYPIVVSGPTYDVYALTNNLHVDDKYYREIKDQGSLSADSVRELEKQNVFGSLMDDRRIKVFAPNDKLRIWHMNKHYHIKESRILYVTAWLEAGEPTLGQIEQFDYYCKMIKMLHEAKRSAETPIESQHEHVLTSMLANTLSDNIDIEELLKIAKMDSSNYWKTAVIQFRNPDAISKTFIARNLSLRFPFVWPLVFSGNIVVITNNERTATKSKQGTIDAALFELISNYDCCVGYSSRFTSSHTIREAYDQALFALQTGTKVSAQKLLQQEFGIKKDYPSRVFDYEEYLLHRILKDYTFEVTDFINGISDVLKIAVYDRENSTQKLNFVYTYLACDRSISKTAKRLGMHRNSIPYQIKTIDKLVGLDIASSRFSSHSALAFAALEMFGLDILSSVHFSQ